MVEGGGGGAGSDEYRIASCHRGVKAKPGLSHAKGVLSRSKLLHSYRLDVASAAESGPPSIASAPPPHPPRPQRPLLHPRTPHRVPESSLVCALHHRHKSLLGSSSSPPTITHRFAAAPAAATIAGAATIRRPRARTRLHSGRPPVKRRGRDSEDVHRGRNAQTPRRRSKHVPQVNQERLHAALAAGDAPDSPSCCYPLRCIRLRCRSVRPSTSQGWTLRG